MKEICGTKYISRKEASFRYGFSIQWFEQACHNGDGPPVFKLRGKGKVLYNLELTDKWFKDNIVLGE